MSNPKNENISSTNTIATMDVLVQRQLDVISSGNGAYLEMFLIQAKRAGLKVRIVFAPWHSFGNRPWSGFHHRFEELVDEVEWPHSIKLGSLYWSLAPHVWARFALRLGKELMRKFGRYRYVESYLGKPLSKCEARIVAAACNHNIKNITVAEYSSMGPVLQYVHQATKFGVLMHDVLSDRGPRFRQRGITPNFLEITPQQEADWVSKADLLIYASANEMQAFGGRVPHAIPVWLRPEPPQYKQGTAKGKPRVVFLGTQHAGNEDALNHFIDDIWPLVKQQEKDLEFWVVGSVGQMLSKERQLISGVKVLGRVEELADIGGEDSIGIAPTRLATGVSIKVVEYLMLGMPCITYPLALEGFGDVLDELVINRPDNLTFAQSVIDLVNNPKQRKNLAQQALEKTPALMSNGELVEQLRTLASNALVANNGQKNKSGDSHNEP